MKRPDPDNRVTDLRRFKAERERERERARRAQAQPPKPAGSESFLGSRPRAGLILAALVAVMAALWILPALL